MGGAVEYVMSFRPVWVITVAFDVLENIMNYF